MLLVFLLRLMDRCTWDSLIKFNFLRLLQTVARPPLFIGSSKDEFWCRCYLICETWLLEHLTWWNTSLNLKALSISQTLAFLFFSDDLILPVTTSACFCLVVVFDGASLLHGCRMWLQNTGPYLAFCNSCKTGEVWSSPCFFKIPTECALQNCLHASHRHKSKLSLLFAAAFELILSFMFYMIKEKS